MNGRTLLMYKSAVNVPNSQCDQTRVTLKCGGYIDVHESPIDGLRILPSGNIKIGSQRIQIKDKDL